MPGNSQQNLVRVDDVTIELDDDGFLLDAEQWSTDVAAALAAENDFNLTVAHWKIIKFVRQYFATYSIEPPMRALVKAANVYVEDGTGGSRYLYQLFPDGPLKDACRYAGLPKPVSCI